MTLYIMITWWTSTRAWELVKLGCKHEKVESGWHVWCGETDPWLGTRPGREGSCCPKLAPGARTAATAPPSAGTIACGQPLGQEVRRSSPLPLNVLCAHLITLPLFNHLQTTTTPIKQYIKQHNIQYIKQHKILTRWVQTPNARTCFTSFLFNHSLKHQRIKTSQTHKIQTCFMSSATSRITIKQGSTRN